jgi:hypothetical protein
MDYTVATKYEPCTLLITVRSLKECVICLEVWDRDRAHTYFMDRIKPAYPGEVIPFQVQMPLSPRVACIRIYDEAIGNRDTGSETSFKVEKVSKTGLHQFLHALDLTHKLRVFIDFAQRFAFNAGVLPTNEPGQAYVSRDHNRMFKLFYLPILVEQKTGGESVTPARVELDTKEFEVSKKKFIDLTVPERMCILCHEYSHHHLNVDMKDELEADLNGLTIYLALGYPPIEAIETYYTTFMVADTDENAYHRLPHIENFIDGFHKEFYQNKNKAA